MSTFFVRYCFLHCPKRRQPFANMMMRLPIARVAVGRALPYQKQVLRAVTTTVSSRSRPRLCSPSSSTLSRIFTAFRNYHMCPTPRVWAVVEIEPLPLCRADLLIKNAERLSTCESCSFSAGGVHFSFFFILFHAACSLFEGGGGKVRYFRFGERSSLGREPYRPVHATGGRNRRQRWLSDPRAHDEQRGTYMKGAQYRLVKTQKPVDRGRIALVLSSENNGFHIALELRFVVKRGPVCRSVPSRTAMQQTYVFMDFDYIRLSSSRGALVAASEPGSCHLVMPSVP